ncbi:MAG: hypothetical protein GY778_03020 [bacterium]|nr:hypothetical protein [bacterium]
MNATRHNLGLHNRNSARVALRSAMGARRPERRSAFTLLLVLALFALVAGLASVLTLHTGQLVRRDRLRTLDIELRQMIDSGAAYARLHHSDWPADDPPQSVVLEATDLTHGDRTAWITLLPTFDEAGLIEEVTVTARIRVPRGRIRSTAARVVVAAAVGRGGASLDR